MSDVAAHIKANNIRARFVGWVGMAEDEDLVKVDGKYMRFNRHNHMLLS